jgi:rRNA maturation endonuclease Nob1
MSQATFKLKCVGCGKVEKRPADQCKEQPFCACGMPMVLQQVKVRHG